DLSTQIQGLTTPSLAVPSGGGGGGDGGGLPSAGIGGFASPASQSTWSTPILPEQRGGFAAVDEASYVVGPGDHFHIATGVRFFNIVVGPEGFVAVEGVPPIHVDKLVLRDARAKILEGLSGHFKRENLH